MPVPCLVCRAELQFLLTGTARRPDRTTLPCEVCIWRGQAAVAVHGFLVPVTALAPDGPGHAALLRVLARLHDLQVGLCKMCFVHAMDPSPSAPHAG